MIMRNGVFSLLAVACAAIGAAPAHAAPDMQALADRSGCFSCHSMHAKIVGPAFADVAAKYKGDADAPTRLAQKVRDGGKGTWGRIPMPPHPNLKEDEAKQLVAWVLSSGS
ncbi:c-type cytochrome [Ralstonia sp. NFACC01]|uniref:c-type cytochrome n=1 Tax=unclassified Ralstonia TaxID=209769 RepID=UPI000B806A5D|nr:c-type cytochrome [Ralstonia sp. NFACC01]